VILGDADGLGEPVTEGLALTLDDGDCELDGLKLIELLGLWEAEAELDGDSDGESEVDEEGLKDGLGEPVLTLIAILWHT